MTTTLTYFDFDGSRGLECRLALTLAGVEFDDNRIKREEWRALKPTLPFGALPMLEVDGRRLPQSTAILRWVGRNHGMHPSDAWAAAEHDALMQSVEDLRHKVPGRGLTEEEKKTAREEFAAGWLTRWAASISSHLIGPYLEGDELHVADLKLYVILRAYLTGGYDYIPPSFFDDFPTIQAFFAAVDAHPGVKAYLEGR